jgi:hypothetical protein
MACMTFKLISFSMIMKCFTTRKDELNLTQLFITFIIQIHPEQNRGAGEGEIVQI